MEAAVAEAEQETVAETEWETGAETEWETLVEAEQESEVKTEWDIEAETEQETEGETEWDIEVETEQETVAETEWETLAEAKQETLDESKSGGNRTAYLQLDSCSKSALSIILESLVNYRVCSPWRKKKEVALLALQYNGISTYIILFPLPFILERERL